MKKRIFVLDAHTNGHRAALHLVRQQGWNKRRCEIIFCGTHAEVFRRLASGPGYAVIPIHNTTRGTIDRIKRILDQFTEQGYRFEQLDTYKLRVDHYLAVKRDGIGTPQQVKHIFSIREALDQCAGYLDDLGLCKDKQTALDSTSQAAKVVAESDHRLCLAALVTRTAAHVFGLHIVGEKVQDVKKNFTTFVLLENKAHVEPVKVAVLGIDGKEGRTFRSLSEHLCCETKGSDPTLGPSPSNVEMVKWADVVFICTPLQSTPEIIRSLMRYTRKDQLIMDVASVKEPAVREMLAGKAQVVGLHPMFAPGTPFIGQTIAVCPARLDNPRWKTWLVNMLAATQAEIKWSDAETHDIFMQPIQVSTCAADLAQALTSAELGIDIQESLEYTSPKYRLSLSLQGRFLKHDPRLYAAILMENPRTPVTLRKTIEIYKRILEVVEAKDYAAFDELAGAARKHFGQKVIDQSDELVTRYISATAAAYSKNSVLLEYTREDDYPGLLNDILKVFRRRKIDLAYIASVPLPNGRCQFAISFKQSRDSDAVAQALNVIRRWNKLEMTIIIP